LDVQKENWNGIEEAAVAVVVVVAAEEQNLTRGDTIEPLSALIAMAPEEAEGWSCNHSRPGM